MKTVFAVLLTVVCACRGSAQEGARSHVTYTDIAEPAGILKSEVWRATFGDVDGDGFQDLLLVKPGLGIRGCGMLWRNLPDPSVPGGRRFEEVTTVSGLNTNRKSEEKGRVMQVGCFGDVDNDGDPDLFSGAYIVTNALDRYPDLGDRNEILQNDGRGGFAIVPGSGVDGIGPVPTQVAGFFDYDRDGCLDLYVGTWYRVYRKNNEGEIDRLYRGAGDGTFRDVTGDAGLMTVQQEDSRKSSKPTYGVTFADWDNDGDPDIFQASYGLRWNMLWRNDGNGRFNDVALETGYAGDPVGLEKWRGNGNTFGAVPCDFDNDGDLDFYVVETTHSYARPNADLSALLINRGKAGGWRFERDEKRIPRAQKEYEDTQLGYKAMNWHWGDHYAAWLDHDNDGLPDLLIQSGSYIEQHLRLFRQRPDRTFVDVSEEAGILCANTNGLTIGDVNRDGWLDIATGSTTPQEHEKIPELPHLFLNRGGNGNHWVVLTLEGFGKGRTNRSALGARVWVKTGDLVQMRELTGACGHTGAQNAMPLHFGLGRRAKIDEIRIRWADAKGTEETIQNVPVDRYLRIREGSGAAVFE